MKTLKKLLDAIGPHDTLIIDKYEDEVEINVLRAGIEPLAIIGRLTKKNREDCIQLAWLSEEPQTLKQSLRGAYQNLRKEQGDMGT